MDRGWRSDHRPSAGSTCALSRSKGPDSLRFDKLSAHYGLRFDKLSAHYGLRFEQAQLERRAASNGARSKTNRL
jgi:hypothetical protein